MVDLALIGLHLLATMALPGWLLASAFMPEGPRTVRLAATVALGMGVTPVGAFVVQALLGTELTLGLWYGVAVGVCLLAGLINPRLRWRRSEDDEPDVDELPPEFLDPDEPWDNQ